MSSGNTQSCSQQQSWQHGNSATPISSRGREPQPQTEAIQKANQILEQIEERCWKNETTSCDGCGRRVKSEVESLARLYSNPASSEYSSLGRST